MEEEKVSLPKMTVIKCAKSQVPGVVIAKEAEDLLVDVCGEFVQLLAHEAASVTEKAGKSLITPQLLMEACKSLGFSYDEELQEMAEDFSETRKRAKLQRSEQAAISPEERERLQELMFAEAAAEMHGTNTAKKPE